MNWILPAIAGVGAGILASWGVGGGTLLLLIMTLFLGVDHRSAQAINLLFFLPTAATGLFLHRKNGYLDSRVWKTAVLPAVAAGLLAALAAMHIEVDLLRKPFGLFLLYTGCSTLWKEWRNYHRDG